MYGFIVGLILCLIIFSWCISFMCKSGGFGGHPDAIMMAIGVVYATFLSFFGALVFTAFIANEYELNKPECRPPLLCNN